MSNSIFITGTTGQLAQLCVQVFREAGYAVHALNRKAFALDDPVGMREVLQADPPSVLINCAAYTGVDAAESDPDAAFAVNARGVGHLACCCRDLGIRLVHVSTDYVFSGCQPPAGGWREDDVPAPRTVYGRSKLAGELAIREAGGEHLILRTAWLYSGLRHDFLLTMLRLLNDPTRDRIPVVNDQHGSPTWARRLAEQMVPLVREQVTGTFHVAGEGSATWFDLARAFAMELGLPDKLVPCSTAEFPRPAARPVDSTLNCGRLRDSGLSLLRPWGQDLACFVETRRQVWIGQAGSGAGLS